MATKKKSIRKKSTRKKVTSDHSRQPHKAVTLRMDLDLHEALVKCASWNRRSLNQQVALYLEADLYSDGYLPEPSFHLDTIDHKPNQQPAHAGHK